MTDKIKHFIKNKNNFLYVLILLLGIMLMTFSGGDEGKISTSSNEEVIENILKRTDVGDVDVFITYRDEASYSSKETVAVSAVVMVEDNSADNIKTVREIVNNVSGIPIHKVIVLKSKN